MYVTPFVKFKDLLKERNDESQYGVTRNGCYQIRKVFFGKRRLLVQFGQRVIRKCEGIKIQEIRRECM